MSEAQEYVLYEKGKHTAIVSFVPRKVAKGLEASLACIEIHQMPPQGGDAYISFSDFDRILDQYRNKAHVLKEMRAATEQKTDVIIGDQ